MERSRLHLRRWIVIAGVLAVVGGLFAYLRWRATPVTVEPVQRGRAVLAVYATGTVEPVDDVVVKARLAETVASVHVREGDRVSAGQVLARIDKTTRALALAQARTALARARAQAGKSSPQLAALEAQVRALRAELETAKTELARSEVLFSGGAIAKRALDSARSRVDQLEAQVANAEEQVRSSRVELTATADQLAAQVASLASETAETVVRAPIGGIVMTRQVEPGEAVSADQTLFTIADPSTLLVELKVDEADIARVRAGPNASRVALTFYGFPGRAFAGTVATIMPDPDRERRSYTVKVRFDEPVPGVRIGMTAEANILVEQRDHALLVPAEAVQGSFAWFAVDGRAVRRFVVLGIQDLTHAEILAGASEGELAIVDAQELEPGARVKPERRR